MTGVRIAVGDDVAVGVGVAVRVGGKVCVGVEVLDSVAVLVAVRVGVLIGVGGTGVDVAVAVGREVGRAADPNCRINCGALLPASRLANCLLLVLVVVSTKLHVPLPVM